MRGRYQSRTVDGEWLSVDCVMRLVLHLLMQPRDKNGWGLMPYRLAVRNCSGGPHPSALISYVPYLIKEFESGTIEELCVSGQGSQSQRWLYRDPRITRRLGLKFEIPATFIKLRCSATSSRLYIFATDTYGPASWW